MAVKFDKDALLKHRFWVLIAVTSLITLGGIGYLELYGSSEAMKRLTEMDGKHKAIKAVKASANSEVIEHWAGKAGQAKKSESTVWSEAYEVQKDIFTWAPEVEDKFHFSNGHFAHDIKISKAVAVAEWPADQNGSLLHGTLMDVRETALDVKTRDGKVVTIYRMSTDGKLITDTEGPEGKKNVEWGSNDLEKHKGKLLAVTYQNGKYFSDKLLPEEQDVFGADSSYKGQIHEILRSVDPYTDKGTGVVQLRGWQYQKDKLPDGSVKFIRFMNKDAGWNVKMEFSKEAWAAQEDIWVQREIYRVIRAANDDISLFHGKGGNQKDKVYTFKNANFALDLHLKTDGVLGFKITNLLSRRQKIDLKFKVKMNANKAFAPETVQFSELPLAPAGFKGDFAQKDFPVNKDEPQRTGIYRVEQLLTWETAAVKRIDHVAIASVDTGDIAHSHRDFVKELRPFDEKDMPKEDKKDAGGPDKGMRPPIDGGAGLGGLGGGKGANKVMMPHGFWTDRYVEVTDQSRRIPIAVALIVDQDHVDRVLTQFMNSKLRFLESQVLLNHHAGSLTPRLDDREEKGGDGPAPPRGFMPPMPGGFKSGSGFGVPMPGMAPPGAGGNNQTANTGAGQDETNMELVIYGVMTLYNRYPPRPKADKVQ